MARGAHRFADMDTRWNPISWRSSFPAGKFSQASDSVDIRTSGVVVVGGASTNTSQSVFMPRGDYRVFIVGGGGGGAYKYTKGTVSVDSNDYATVSGGKYSMAGGGSGAIAVIDVHVKTPVSASVVAGRAGAKAANSTTKATNGGASSFSIEGLVSVSCGGGVGGTAKDGASGTAGVGGTVVYSGSGFSFVYQANGFSGTRRYTTAWTTKNNADETKWPEAYGGRWNSQRTLGYRRSDMADVLAISSDFKTSLYGTHKATFLCRDTNGNADYSVTDYSVDETTPAGSGELIPVGFGGCASLWIFTGNTVSYDGHNLAGVGIVAIQNKRRSWR